MSADKNQTVYSTEHDTPKKKLPVTEDRRVPQPCVPVAQQRVRVRLDKKGRGGKSVTMIEGLLMVPNDLESLLKRLKTRLGTGGAVKDSVIEIQGDHCDTVISVLESSGFRPKRCGG